MKIKVKLAILLQIFMFVFIVDICVAQSQSAAGKIRVRSRKDYTGDRLFLKGRKYFRDGDTVRGLKFLNHASQRDQVSAKLLLANIYRNGLKVEKDLSLAFKYYRELDEMDEPLGSYNAGVFLENGWGVEKDYLKALSCYEKAARIGKFAEAQRAMGSMYFAGRGVGKSYSEAWKWYLKSAEQGNPRGLYNVALMKEKGLGTVKNKEEALKWYKEAAAAGNLKSMYALGLRYELGEIVKQDFQAALKWYGKAATAGEVESFYRMGLLFRSGVAGEKDNASAIQSFGRAAQNGHMDSFCEVGLMYEKGGGGIDCDPAISANWYAAAAEKGYERAQFLLGLLYLEGRGVKQDQEKGMSMIKAAAKKNYPEAVRWLENNLE